MIHIEKINKRSIPQMVADQIIQLIVSGKLKPGDKLPSEKQLEEMFGVSRPSIREALSALNLAEIINMCHGEGSFVRDININTHIHPLAVKMLIHTGKVYELLETRLTLEPQIAALAAKRATEDNLAELETTMSEMKEQVLAGDLAQDIDSKFHLLISKSSQNVILHNIMENLVPIIRHHQMHTRQYSRMLPGRPLAVVEQHEHIYKAIKKGDSRAAGRFMESHLQDVKKNCRHIECLIAGPYAANLNEEVKL